MHAQRGTWRDGVGGLTIDFPVDIDRETAFQSMVDGVHQLVSGQRVAPNRELIRWVNGVDGLGFWSTSELDGRLGGDSCEGCSTVWWRKCGEHNVGNGKSRSERLGDEKKRINRKKNGSFRIP